MQPRGRGLDFGRWGFGPLPSGKHRRRWRRLGGWRALGRGAPTVSTLPWSLGSIRRVRCFPNWGSRKARRHLGRWRWRWRWAAGWILQPRGRGLEFGRWWFGPLPNGKHRRRGRWRRLGGHWQPRWRALGWRGLRRGAPVVCTFSWSHRLRFSEDLKQSGSQHRNKKLSIRGRDRPGPASRLYSRPKAAAPLPTENSSNRLLRDWCWLWCWCWCFLLLVVLDAVLARYRMQMTMT